MLLQPLQFRWLASAALHAARVGLAARRAVKACVFFATLFGSLLGLGLEGAPALAASIEREPEPAGVAAADAPMCDPLGASVAARPEMDLPIVDSGRVEELPCEGVVLLRGYLAKDLPDHAAAGSPERQEPSPRDAARSRGESACQLAAPSIPLRSVPCVIALGGSPELAPSRGHFRGVFRPPVRAA